MIYNGPITINYILLSLLLIFLDGEMIPFYSCLSVEYTQHEGKYCIWPPGEFGERFYSLEEATTGCANLPGCTMFHQNSDLTVFSTCPVGSTFGSADGYTLYTAMIGKLS